jgi:hypothetical protein
MSYDVVGHVSDATQARGATPTQLPAVERHGLLQLQRLAGNKATTRALQGSLVAVAQRSGDAPNQSRDLATLDDVALTAERDRAVAALSRSSPQAPDYASNAAYLESIERAMAARPALGTAITSVPAQQPTVEDLTQLILHQRGFGSTAGTRTRPPRMPAIDPTGVGNRHLGQGYEVNAAVMVTDRTGEQMATELGQYARGSDPHAEAQAVERLTARMPEGSAVGGELVVVVDQDPCPACQTRLMDLARRLGCRRVIAYGPSRMGPGGLPVSPRTAARSSTQGTRPGGPPREQPVPRELWSADTGVGTAPVASSSASEPLPASGVAEPAAAAGVVAEPVATPASGVSAESPAASRPAATGEPVEGGGGSGAAGGVLSIAAGFLYQWAHQGAVERRRDTEGYAPVGPLEFAEEGLFSRIGRLIMDPTLDTQSNLEARLNVPVWRNQIRQAVANAPGGVFRMTYQVQFPSQVLQDIRDVPVTYARQPDGTWRVTSGTEGFPPGISVPDLNRILDTGVSDAEVRGMLLYDPYTA